MDTTNPNRRQIVTGGTVIGAGMLVAAATGATILTDPALVAASVSVTAWDRALAAYRRADDEMNAWNKGPQQQAYDAFEEVEKKFVRPRLGDELPAELAAAHDAYAPYEQRFDELVGVRDRALETVFFTPAPTIAAITVKLELWQEHDLDGWGIGKSLFDAIVADTKRLSAA